MICVRAVSFLTFCSNCPQNMSLIAENETTVIHGNSMKHNPHVHYYSTVYVISMGAALLLKTIRGLVFVKVRLGGGGLIGDSLAFKLQT